jgi:hypothetical protein
MTETFLTTEELALAMTVWRREEFIARSALEIAAADNLAHFGIVEARKVDGISILRFREDAPGWAKAALEREEKLKEVQEEIEHFHSLLHYARSEKEENELGDKLAGLYWKRELLRRGE